ncbi:Cof subfamily protein (haloacid dehalogenase superfamily) [Paenibacillus forsythiae]|uniref:Cof subfamily protein (Haloacid dehalogenase superfamily) n=1 Tax=Paenibacillus forsythiae TaxID=365616 RepID=A0ABU3H9Y6_9BACL|nr:Cof-type HAD-IIB family hydrolase [Paenibacillus forsythiae]MDT3427634.1 Cof subfamily protein (haloacid dehalogenase superfamily) [Paenibacillus forsythiae]
MAYKIVFFDIDGTLVNEEKEIPEDTLRAVSRLKQNGVEPVIATGRAPYFIKPLAEALGIDSYVCLNGAYVVYKGKTLYKRALPKETIQALITLAARNGHSLVFEGEDTYFADSENHPFVTESVNTLKVDQPGFDPDFWKNNEIYQMFLHCESHEEALYEELLSQLRLIRWHPLAMDVLPPGSSKAKGIEAMLSMLGISTGESVAFGDGLNDKEMLELVGMGIAMGNSHEELLPYADYVTSHVDEGGIYNGLVKAGLI